MRLNKFVLFIITQLFNSLEVSLDVDLTLYFMLPGTGTLFFRSIIWLVIIIIKCNLNIIFGPTEDASGLTRVV